MDKNTVDLIYASIDGDLEKIKRLLAAGADVHAQHESPLINASDHGHSQVVKFLVTDAGADIHGYNDRALMWASHKGHLDVV